MQVEGRGILLLYDYTGQQKMIAVHDESKANNQVMTGAND